MGNGPPQTSGPFPTCLGINIAHWLDLSTPQSGPRWCWVRSGVSSSPLLPSTGF